MTNTPMVVGSVVFWIGILVLFIVAFTGTSLEPYWLVVPIILSWIVVATNIILKANLDDKQEKKGK